MKVLRNYILSQLMSPLIVSTLVLTLIFVLGNLVKIAELILNKGVDTFALLHFMGLIIPEMLTFTLPTSLLASILLVFGDLAEHNEIIAIKASGVSVLRSMFPVFILGFLLSIGVLILSDQFLPNNSFQARKMLKKMFLNDPFAHMRPGVPTQISDKLVFLAREIEEEGLRNVTIYQPQDEKPTRTILADRCEIKRVQNKVRVRLFNGTIDEPDTKNSHVFNKLDFQVYELPLIDLEDIDRVEKKTREFSLDELMTLRESGAISERKKLEYKIEIHKKISFAFGCFIFSLIGVPVAIITRRGNILLSFGLAIFFMTIYYVLYSWAQAMASQLILQPEIALWIPSAVFLVFAIIAMLKVMRS